MPEITFTMEEDGSITAEVDDVPEVDWEIDPVDPEEGYERQKKAVTKFEFYLISGRLEDPAIDSES